MRAVTELRTASTSCIAHTYTPDTLSALTQRYRLLHAGLLFFTTYTLLVLFWAEIYHQARSMPTGSLRPIFAGINIVVYAVLVRFMGGRQLCRLLAHLGSSLFKNGRIACGKKTCWSMFADHDVWANPRCRLHFGHGAPWRQIQPRQPWVTCCQTCL